MASRNSPRSMGRRFITRVGAREAMHLFWCTDGARTWKPGIIMGHSMGTPVARQFYRKYPKKTLAIVIVDGGLRPFGDKAMRDQFMTAFRSENYREAGTQMFAQM